MVRLIFLLHLLENLKCLFRRSRLYYYFLEPPFKRAVFLYILTVFIKGCRAYALNLTTGKCRFENIRGIHGSGCASRTDNRVNLVYKKYYVGILCKFVKNRLDSLFKLTTVFCPGNHPCKIKSDDPLVKQYPRNLSLYYSQRKTFYNGRLSHSRLSYQNGIVFFTTGKNLRKTLNLRLTSHYRIKTSLGSRLCHIITEFVKGRSVTFDLIFSRTFGRTCRLLSLIA